MAIITIVSGSYCNGDDIISKASKRLNYDQINNNLLEDASQRFDVSKDEVLQILTGEEFIQSKTSGKSKKILGYLETTLAEIIQKDNVILSGSAGYLIPGNISHFHVPCRK